jgi:hypothetical protein
MEEWSSWGEVKGPWFGFGEDDGFEGLPPKERPLFEGVPLPVKRRLSL